MARTIKEIADGMKEYFVENSDVRNLYNLNDAWGNRPGTSTSLDFYNTHFSVVSIETIFIYLIATVANAIEALFDQHKADITHIVETERFGLPGWYKKMALQFRYGADLDENYYDPDGDFADTDIYPAEYQNNEHPQIVKYAYAEETAEHLGVTIKVAKTDDNDDLCPLDDGTNDTQNEIAAFEAYMNRIKPAGIPITVINKPADTLVLYLTVLYNPLVMNGNGELVSDTSVKPVETAIQQYLNSIEFNGRFIPMKLIDAVQLAEGVKVADITSATGQHAGYSPEPIGMFYTPYAGYMKLESSNLHINYEAYA
ncbi:MAG: hypothetical protein IKO34_04900 [Bacteroidales bacterium]|nr:hypothetical protein [Bacteroidales bacterium]